MQKTNNTDSPNKGRVKQPNHLQCDKNSVNFIEPKECFILANWLCLGKYLAFSNKSVSDLIDKFYLVGSA